MLKTFRIGGIHPKENKLSAGEAIVPCVLPKQVVVTLGQHVGAPAQPIVRRGSVLRVGTIIGRSVGFVSANVHSPVSGTVSKIDVATDCNGYQQDAVFIDVEGDVWDASIDRSEDVKRECVLSREEILERIAEAGVVGLGSVVFPTHVKLMPPPGTKVDRLIINGAESEPFLTCDHALMLEKAEEILVGTSILMEAVGANKAFVGVESNKGDALARLREVAVAYPYIEVVGLKTKFPQGSEKLLIDAILGRRVPGGGLPASVGVVVQNVATTFAVYEAVQKNKPLVERVITVTGRDVKRPCNVRSRIGTSARWLIDFAGGLPDGTGAVLSGGPMLGKALEGLDVPVTKGTGGLVVIPAREVLGAEMRNCIRCAKCVNVCPMGLNPTLLMTLSERENWVRVEKELILDCIECGACSYVCPSNRPLLDHIRWGKRDLNRIKKMNP